MSTEEMMIEVETIMLTMEDNVDQEFAILDYFDHEGKQYVIVSKVNGDTIEEDTFLYGYSEDEEDIIIEYIEDDDEYDKLVAAYEAFVAQFEDEEE